jgi:hypothetical protein
VGPWHSLQSTVRESAKKVKKRLEQKSVSNMKVYLLAAMLEFVGSVL